MEIKTIHHCDVNSYMHIQQGALVRKEYMFAVRAVNPARYSNNSNEVTATIPG